MVLKLSMRAQPPLLPALCEVQTQYWQEAFSLHLLEHSAQLVTAPAWCSPVRASRLVLSLGQSDREHVEQRTSINPT